MDKRILLLPLLLFRWVLSPALALEPELPQGFRAIFNGKNLAGWHGLNPHSVAKLKEEKRDAKLEAMREEFADHWRVENGELVNDGYGWLAPAVSRRIADARDD